MVETSHGFHNICFQPIRNPAGHRLFQILDRTTVWLVDGLRIPNANVHILMALWKVSTYTHLLIFLMIKVSLTISERFGRLALSTQTFLADWERRSRFVTNRNVWFLGVDSLTFFVSKIKRTLEKSFSDLLDAKVCKKQIHCIVSLKGLTLIIYHFKNSNLDLSYCISATWQICTLRLGYYDCCLSDSGKRFFEST